MRISSVFSASCKAFAFAAALSLSATAFAAVPQTINYQALITNNVGAPATSTNVDVKVDFYSAPTGGTLLDTQTFTGLNLGNSGGYVNLPVDVTGINLAGDLYAELTVTDVAAAGSPEVLAPRQKVNSVPFALKAASLDGAWASRVMFVNPDSAAAVASPNGSITAPFKDINAAVAAASAIPNGYNNRTVVMLLPGRHTVTSTINLSDQGLDLVGYGEKSAALYGAPGVSPLINATAVGGTGSVVRNLLIQVPTGSGNTALSIVDGRVENCIISQAGGAVASNLVSIATVNNTSISDTEIIGDVNVTSYGEQLSFNRGYISGIVTVTAAPSTLTSRLLLTNLGAIGGLNVATVGPFPAIVAMSNIAVAPNVTYGSNTLFVAQSVNFVTAAVPPTPYQLPDPLPPSMLVNCMADTSLWTAPAVTSLGNIPGAYSAFTQK